MQFSLLRCRKNSGKIAFSCTKSRCRTNATEKLIWVWPDDEKVNMTFSKRKSKKYVINVVFIETKYFRISPLILMKMRLFGKLFSAMKEDYFCIHSSQKMCAKEGRVFFLASSLFKSCLCFLPIFIIGLLWLLFILMDFHTKWVLNKMVCM